MYFTLCLFLLFSETNKSDYYEEASLLIKDSKFKEAVTPLSNLIKEEPKNDKAINLLGIVYKSINQLDKAEKYFFEALSTNTNNNEARLNLAGVAFSKGFTQKAVLLYNEALKIKPDEIKALESLAVISISLGKFEDAKVFYKRVTEKEPNRIGLNMGLGIIAMSEKNISEARKRFLKEAELDPSNNDAVFNLAYSYEFNLKGERGAKDADYTNAIKYYKQIMEKSPDFLLAPFNLGLVYAKQENYKDAIKVTEEALKESKDKNDKVYYNLACFYSLNKDESEAIKSFEEAVKLGFRDFEKIESDKDLDNIRNNKKFIKIVEKYKKKIKP